MGDILAAMTHALGLYAKTFGWPVVGGLLVLVGVSFLRARSRGRGRATAEVVTVAAGLPLLATALLPTTGPGQLAAKPGTQLGPLISGQGASADAVHALATVLILMPLAAVVPMLWSSARSWRRILVGAVVAAVLSEGMQFVLPSGRVSSVDDVVLLVVGAGMGALATMSWWHNRGAAPAAAAVAGG